MKNPVLAGIVAFLIISAVILGAYTFTVLNKADTLITLYEGKELTNKTDFDNMSKQINQSAQVSKAQMDKLKEIYTSYAEARTGESDSSNAIAKWVQESVPNVDTGVMRNLQNIIVAARNGWAEKQRELVGISIEYNTMLRVRPSKWILRNYTKLNPTIITSEDTEQAFHSGQENNIKLDL